MDPSQIPWGAIATILTGLLAVGGATAVGFRQAKILGEQAAASRQNNQIALFEKRYEVYQSIEKFVVAILSAGGKTSQEIEQNFHRSRGKARFIFGEEVNAELKALWSDYCDMCLGQDLMRASMDATGTNGPENVRQKHEALQKIANTSDRLPEIFAELRPHHAGRAN